MRIIEGVEQGTEEWLSLRLGKVTGSNFDKVMSGGQGKTRDKYMSELIAEILTGQPTKFFYNDAMKWGNECEPQARSMYEFNSCVDVKEVTFIEYNEHVGVSPDGLVGENGLVEFKCPASNTQIDRVLKGEFPTCYKAQVQGQIWVSEREWCDFVSFDPRIKGRASYFIYRVERDDFYIKELENTVNKFVDEMLEKVDKLK